MLLEDAQETVLIRERQMSVMSSPFTVYSEGNVPKSVMGYWLPKYTVGRAEEKLLSELNALLLAQIPPIVLKIVRCKKINLS